MVAVALGGEYHHVLAAGLSRQWLARIGVGNGLCRLGAAGEYDMLHHGRGGEQRCSLAVGDDHLQGLLGHAGLPERLGEEPCHGSRHGGRLQYAGVARGEGGYHAAAGYGAREVPRRQHEHSALGHHVNVVELGKLLHRGGVEAAVVDALAHFHVAFLYGLARDGTHGAAEVAAHLAEDVGSLIHYPVTLLDGGLAPEACILLGNVENLLGLLLVGSRHLAYRHIAGL